MLGILAVPPVTAHNAQPPYQPTGGGVDALVYRAWEESDLLPQEIDDHVPSTMAKEESIRCCIESICAEDFSAAIQCLTGAIGNTVDPAG